MLYLLDADTLITGERQSYRLHRFPIFWEWLRYQGHLGNVKVPQEQFEEVVAGRGDLVDWLTDEATKEAMLFDEEVDPVLVARVTLEGYGNLDENRIEQIGRDPFLIAYALADPPQRTVVSFEVSAPSKRGANRKVPDVCHDFGVPCGNLYLLIDALDFTTNWRP